MGGPVCGNHFVERGEQCDCGTPEAHSGNPLRGKVGSRDLRLILQAQMRICKPLSWTSCFAALIFLMFLTLLPENNWQRMFVPLDVCPASSCSWLECARRSTSSKHILQRDDSRRGLS